MMDNQTREGLGRICRWLLLLVVAAGGVLVAAAMVQGFPHTLETTHSWSLAPDSIWRTSGGLGPEEGSYTLVYSRPMLPHKLNLFYVREPGQAARRASNDSEKPVSYLRLHPHPSPGLVPFRVVPNPYSGFTSICDNALLEVFPLGTEVLVLDTRSVLAMSANGSLSPLAEQDWPTTSASVPMAALARSRPMVYLLTAPLRDYDRARTLLRRGPAGAVLAASADFDQPARVSSMLGAMRSRLWLAVRQPPMLATEDPVLAADAAAAGVQVYLVGASTPPATTSPTTLPPHRTVGPPRPVIVLPDWQALLGQLGQ